jgi:hypothetical protein
MNRVEGCTSGYCGKACARACEETVPLSRTLRSPSTINCVILEFNLCVLCVAMYLYVGFLLGRYYLVDSLICVWTTTPLNQPTRVLILVSSMYFCALYVDYEELNTKTHSCFSALLSYYSLVLMPYGGENHFIAS